MNQQLQDLYCDIDYKLKIKSNMVQESSANSDNYIDLTKNDGEESIDLLPEIRLQFITTLNQIYEHFLEQGAMHPETYVKLLDLIAATRHEPS